ncbi:MAG TPA: hypothetical protein VKW06_12395 [Candidatus Angelobacter sp.]|nr:hypothetical protein [Candidatus Angelobacter sp.]
MRFAWFAFLLIVSEHGFGQGTPPPSSGSDEEISCYHNANGTPPEPPEAKIQRVKAKVTKEVRKAIERSDPPIEQWQPLTPRQKFNFFLKHTVSPRTFAGAALDATADKWQNDNTEYARGLAGYSQHYAVELGTGESDVLFEAFLIPTILKQDPRYFRNPSLPFLKRVLYSLSRVLITRNDSGHQTFNASYVLGSAASQALSDVYIPGHVQGMHPIVDRLTFNLARDAGFNLLHEFWPELRGKLLPANKVKGR